MAQAGNTPDPQMASASNPKHDNSSSSSTTISQPIDLITNDNNNDQDLSHSDNPESSKSATAEERSAAKLAQITQFADKYGLKIDPKRVSPASLELDNLNLDFIQVSVQSPALQKKDSKGNKLTKDQSKRLQLAMHDALINRARQGIIREELRAILRSPDFSFNNSDPDNLVPNQSSSSSSQSENGNDEENIPTPLVPTPQEDPNAYLEPRFIDNLPKDFDRAVFRELFAQFPIRLSGTSDVYIRSISDRINALRALREKYIVFNREIRNQDGSDSRDARIFITLNSAYITVAQANLHFYKTLRSQFDATPAKKSKNSKKKSKQSKKSNSSKNNNNNSKSRPRPSKNRDRIPLPNNGNDPNPSNIPTVASASNNNNNNNNNNSNNNSNSSQVAPAALDPLSQAHDEEFKSNFEKYSGVAGKESARRTTLLKQAVSNNRNKKSVCIVLSRLARPP